MALLDPNTITITGLDDKLNEDLLKLINEVVHNRGFVATVRIERAQRPHYLYRSVQEMNDAVDANPGYERTKADNPAMIALNGHFTVNELDGISFKLRGGK